MKIEESIFRIKPDHEDSFSFTLTRTELSIQLEAYFIKKSYSWFYSLKAGKIITLKNKYGKEIKVIREKSYYDGLKDK